jgi:hypothetical protein
MPRSKIQFTAAKVRCSEAIDWEIVQVNFDTLEPSVQDEERTSPYLSIFANFEFSERVQIAYLDGMDHEGDSLNRIDLWRNRISRFPGVAANSILLSGFPMKNSPSFGNT